MPRIQLASTFEPSASGGAVGEERDEARDPAGAGRAGDAGPGPLEPGLDRELGEIELGRVAERDVRPGTAEIEGDMLPTANETVTVFESLVASLAL